MFVYEGRTSSILSATSSANSYITFNPVISHTFVEGFAGIAMPEELDDFSALASASPSHVTPEESQYLHLLAAMQYGDPDAPSCDTPAVLINRAGSTELTGTNWLLPVAAKDNYEQFFDAALNSESYRVSDEASRPLQTRLWACGWAMRRRRGRVGRGGRIVIDRVREAKPCYGDQAREIYRSALPMAAVRKRCVASESAGQGMHGVALPGIALPSQNLPYVTSVPFGQVNPSCATSVKRSYQEVMQDQNVAPYYNLEGALTFNLANEMPVRVEPVKRMILNRNTVNDQIQFFL